MCHSMYLCFIVSSTCEVCVCVMVFKSNKTTVKMDQFRVVCVCLCFASCLSQFV